VLFPFGFGLSYAKYEYSDLKITTGKDTTLRFTVKNTGSRAGAETAELYAALPDEAGEPPKRLIGWSKVRLKQGESREIEVFINPKYLSIYDEAQDRWKLMPGRYMFLVGGSSRDLPLHEAVEIK
jgi:beta-glucosidase